MKKSAATKSKSSDELKLTCKTPKEWDAWLAKNHGTSTGVLLVFGKKDGPLKTPTYAEALDVALCWGWIDAVKRKHDEHSWLQRFTPRRPKSPWSKINRVKALALIEAGKMMPPGLLQVERAKADGRWDSAYDSASTSTVPDDLTRALSKNKRASAFFADLDRTNRYAILYRVQTAKKPETRAKRIVDFVAMLAKGETLYPPRKKK